jgi:hypothetical protein
LHTTRRNALTDTSPVDLTASSAGNGEIWRLDKDNDTRPIFVVIGTSGEATFTRITYSDHELIQATTPVTWDTCQFVKCTSLDLTGGGSERAVLTGCTVTTPSILEFDWFVSCDNFNDVDNTGITSGGRGHAFRCNAAGSYPYSAIITNGYASGTQLQHQFDNTDDVDPIGDTITLPASHGCSPVSPKTITSTSMSPSTT